MGIGTIFAFIFGAASTALDAIQLGQELFPPQIPDKTTVRITLGESANFNASLSGHIPGVALWNRFGQQIGRTASNKERLAQGGFVDIVVEHEEDIGNIPAEYMSISSGGDDAICISWITVTFPDGGFSTFLPGDAGSQCGFDWFVSSRELERAGHTPRCLWIDKNGSGGLKHQGFGVHLRDFNENQGRLQSYIDNRDLLCKSGPRFRMYEKLKASDSILYFDPDLEYTPEGLDKDPSRIINNPGKTTLKRRHYLENASPGEYIGRPVPSNATNSTSQRDSSLGSFFDGRLIISNMATHSAKNLCESQSSFGPDFVAMSEQLFCDMSQKTLYPLCSTNNMVCCFDLEESRMRSCMSGVRRMAGTRRQSVSAIKSYDKIQRWGIDDKE